MKWLEKVRIFIGSRKIFFGLASAVVIALITTIVSVWIYNTSDVSRLDISRPGYEKARESVLKVDETINFSASGTLDSNAMKDFQKLFDEKRKALSGIGRFDGNVLDDDQLKTATSN